MTVEQQNALRKFRLAVKQMDKAGMSVFVASGGIDVYFTPDLPVNSRGSVDQSKEHGSIAHINTWDVGDY